VIAAAAEKSRGGDGKPQGEGEKGGEGEDRVDHQKRLVASFRKSPRSKGVTLWRGFQTVRERERERGA